MIPTETTQTRSSIKQATELIRKLDKMMQDPLCTPQRLKQLKHWQNSLIANNRSADSQTISQGVAQVEKYLNDEQREAEASRPRSMQEIIDEQAKLYKDSHARQRRLDKAFTDNGHLGKVK
jgi:hypothetical protein